MREEKNIPFKNYIILAITLIFSIIIIIYFYMWYSEFEINKISTPILDDYLSVINYNELDDFLIENKNVILYISTLENKETRYFENKFRDIINNYSLNSDIVYMDLTNEKHNQKLYDSIVKKYKLLNLPCIVIFDNNDIIDVYSIKDNNFDVDLLVSYFRIEGIIND